MFVYIGNENAYLHYFKQLVELDYLITNKETDNLRKFEIMPFIEVGRTKNFKIKKSNDIKYVGSNTVKDTITNKISSKNTVLEEIILN